MVGLTTACKGTLALLARLILRAYLAYDRYRIHRPTNEQLWISSGRRIWLTEMLRRYCDFDDVCKAGSIFWQAITPRVHSCRQCPLPVCPTAESFSAWSVCNANTMNSWHTVWSNDFVTKLNIEISSVSGIWTSSFFTDPNLIFRGNSFFLRSNIGELWTPKPSLWDDNKQITCMAFHSMSNSSDLPKPNQAILGLHWRLKSLVPKRCLEADRLPTLIIDEIINLDNGSYKILAKRHVAFLLFRDNCLGQHSNYQGHYWTDSLANGNKSSINNMGVIDIYW